MVPQSVRVESSLLRSARLFIAVFLPAFCLLFLLAYPVRAFAAEDGWNASGTCEWRVDDEGCLTVRPADGVSGALGDWGFSTPPWYDERASVLSARFEGVVTAKTALWMFDSCSSLVSLDLSGLDTSSVIDMNGMF